MLHTFTSTKGIDFLRNWFLDEIFKDVLDLCTLLCKKRLWFELTLIYTTWRWFHSYDRYSDLLVFEKKIFLYVFLQIFSTQLIILAQPYPRGPLFQQNEHYLRMLAHKFQLFWQLGFWEEYFILHVFCLKLRPPIVAPWIKKIKSKLSEDASKQVSAFLTKKMFNNFQIFPLTQGVAFIFHFTLLCATFGWNWSSDSKKKRSQKM